MTLLVFHRDLSLPASRCAMVSLFISSGVCFRNYDCNHTKLSSPPSASVMWSFVFHAYVCACILLCKLCRLRVAVRSIWLCFVIKLITVKDEGSCVVIKYESLCVQSKQTYFIKLYLLSSDAGSVQSIESGKDVGCFLVSS